jgi:hypothetical protein
MTPCATTDDSAGFIASKIKFRIIELSLRRRIGGKQNLKASVETKAFDNIGAHPSPDAVAAFKAKGFAVTERVVPNAGHCEFDAHGEAIGIWKANP